MFQGKRIRINMGHMNYFLYIDEAVDLIIQASVGARGGRFNLTSGGFANERISGLFGKIAGRDVDAEYVDLGPGVEDPVFVSDVDKFRAGWVRHIPIEQAIGEIIRLSA